ncbi:MAG: SdpI family protein [Armatimonadetes bacterium]|nr:SdpI family protein [Armatimonadota bacterium]
MRLRTLFLGGTGIVLLTVLYTALMYARLPESIATHWDIHGRADQFSPRFWGVVFGPIVQTGMLLLFLVLPSLSPERARLEASGDVYGKVCLTVVAFMGFVQVLIVQSALGMTDTAKWIVCSVLVLFGYIGNIITKARRNYFMGIRTPWTLESEDVWNRTHRLGGRLMVAGSIVGLVLVFTNAPLWSVFAVILVASLWPVVYSYLIYRRSSRPYGL